MTTIIAFAGLLVSQRPSIETIDIPARNEYVVTQESVYAAGYCLDFILAELPRLSAAPGDARQRRDYRKRIGEIQKKTRRLVHHLNGRQAADDLARSSQAASNAGWSALHTRSAESARDIRRLWSDWYWALRNPKMRAAAYSELYSRAETFWHALKEMKQLSEETP